VFIGLLGPLTLRSDAAGSVDAPEVLVQENLRRPRTSSPRRRARARRALRSWAARTRSTVIRS